MEHSAKQVKLAVPVGFAGAAREQLVAVAELQLACHQMAYQPLGTIHQGMAVVRLAVVLV